VWRGILQPRWQWHLFGLSVGHLLLRQRRSSLQGLPSRGSFLCAGQCGTRGMHVPLGFCLQCQRTSGEVPSEHVQSRRGWRVHPLPTVHNRWPRRGCLPTRVPDIHWRRHGVSASGVCSFFVRPPWLIPVGDMAVEVLSLQCADPVRSGEPYSIRPCAGSRAGRGGPASVPCLVRPCTCSMSCEPV
jgi:hypothetical protein